MRDGVGRDRRSRGQGHVVLAKLEVLQPVEAWFGRNVRDVRFRRDLEERRGSRTFARSPYSAARWGGIHSWDRK